MNMTSQDVQKMAAANVAAFKDGGIPLQDSIVKTASDNNMNTDQVRRLIETTNQMAYLSGLDGNDDRTYEFDVASYDGVMDSMMPTMSKEASHEANPMDLVTDIFETPMEKVAYVPYDPTSEMTDIGKVTMLTKLASTAKNRIKVLEGEEYDGLIKLAQYKEKIKRDAEALEKMASFDNALDMTKLVFGHDKVASDVRHEWSPEEMREVSNLSSDLEMIKAANTELKELRPKIERADALLKEAVLGAAIKAVPVKKMLGKSKSAYTGIKNKGAAANAAGLKTFRTADAIGSTHQIKKDTKRNFDAWSSLRG